MYKFDLEDLMDTIYAAPLDGTKWQNILGFINKTFPETRTSIVFYDGRVDYDATHSLHDFDASAMGAYGEYYASVNPWVAANERTPLGKTTFSRDYVPTKDLKQSEFFNDWLRFQGDVDEGIGAVLARDPERIGLLGIHYLSEKTRPERLDELKIFCDVLAPHLQRAFEMRRRMEGLESRADRLEATLDLLAGAVFILTSRGRVQYANKRAEQYLRAYRGIHLDASNKLVLTNAKEHGALRKALAAVDGNRSSDINTAKVSPAFPVTFGDDMLTALVLPVSTHLGSETILRHSTGGAGRQALLFLIDPREETIAPEISIKTALGITAAEAKLAAALLQGVSPDEFADERQLSKHTVRNQMRSLLAKTGMRRQIDLVRMLQKTFGVLQQPD